MRAERRAVGLTAYPEMVVRHPGMRVHRPRGLPRPFGPGPQIQKSWKAKPDGLLLQEGLVWSLIPVHLLRDTIKPSSLPRFARETSAHDVMFSGRHRVCGVIGRYADWLDGTRAKGLLPFLLRGVFHAAGPVAHRGADTSR
jgi:hypothetical protein